jgi:hypothetical protein
MRSRKAAKGENQDLPTHHLNRFAPSRLRAFAPSRDANFLATMRQKFHELHGGTYPLRIAVGKLQTLDTISIIGGKAWNQ